MTEKGVDGATMLEIAERADVGAGTVYNYFKSKDDLPSPSPRRWMHDLAPASSWHEGFADPVEVYAWYPHCVSDTATRR